MADIGAASGRQVAERILSTRASVSPHCYRAVLVSMTIVHAADLHLDSPLRGLSRYEGAPIERIRGATREAFANLIGLCLEREAELLLIAGDIFDGDWRDYATGLFFVSQLRRLREVGTQAVLLHGNHDAASPITRDLELPEHCRVLSAVAPETIEFDHVAVHGQSFASRDVSEDLASQYPDPVPGAVNVGLLHTALTGRPGHASYAPTSIGTLVDRGYDYWALGHVHAREVVNQDPWIVFPGNLQARHVRETGEKGATVVTLDGSSIASACHVALDVVRWCYLRVACDEAHRTDDVLEAVRVALDHEYQSASGRLLAARVELVGTSRVHGALVVEEEAFEANVRLVGRDLGDIWIESVRIRTQPPVDRARLAQRDDAIGQLVRALNDLGAEESALSDYARELQVLQSKLPREARQGDDGVRIDDPAYLKEALSDVEGLLLPLLLGNDGDAG